MVSLVVRLADNNRNWVGARNRFDGIVVVVVMGE
jgi:hypothetical protein